jgi:hypothetical protein
VLPTTVLLLLVLTLTVGSIGLRTYTRAQQTIGERQQRVIYNAATPAIDRAKAKLEYLFDARRDYRRPAGIPSETQLLGMLYNDGREIELPDGTRIQVAPLPPINGLNVYDFPDETRIDINGDGQTDNAWKYQIDRDADGDETNKTWVAYSILFSTPGNYDDLKDSRDPAIRDRAGNLQVRHGPLSNASQQNPDCILPGAALAPSAGWAPDQSNSSILRKNFQVDAYVQPINGTSTTLEFHQDREVNRGNRWGAWFRNDLEIFPGPQFNWNGAMHTEGNLIVGGDGSFNGYLISSPWSCFYEKEASKVTVTQIDPTQEDIANNIPKFQGQFLSGQIGTNAFASKDKSIFHLDNGQGVAPTSRGLDTDFNPDRDSVDNANKTPIDYALDPVVLQTRDVSQARNVNYNADTVRDAAWRDREISFLKRERMENSPDEPPYLDDTFRADNRYGPKPRYNKDIEVSGFIGQPIPVTSDLIVDTPEAGSDCSTVGLDGYWERRARCEGVRLIVGERLELGDPAGWGGPAPTGNAPDQNLTAEPLRPWLSCPANSLRRCHEARQRKSLWDNLAAVQATAVYHYASEDADQPVACLATTVHPGTARTLRDSSTFERLFGSNANPPDPATGFPLVPELIPDYTDGPTDIPIISDFFRGIGTNGWEFEVPDAADFDNQNSAMRKALNNLANFAGDPNGGAPSFTPEVVDGFVHPYPTMAMWGDFSMLRRILDEYPGFNNLSPADKTVLYTSACTLGMLAYNIDYLEKFNLDAIDNNSIYPGQSTDVAINYTLPDGRLSPKDLIGYKIGTDANEINRSDPRTDPRYYVGLRGAIRSLMDGTSPLSDPGRTNPTSDGDPRYPLLINPNPGTSPQANFQSPGNAAGNPLKESLSVYAEAQASIAPGKMVATYGEFTGGGLDNPEAFVRLLERWRDRVAPPRGTGTPQEVQIMNNIIGLAKIIITKEQVARDRVWGFGGAGTTLAQQYYVPYTDVSGLPSHPEPDAQFDIPDSVSDNVTPPIPGQEVDYTHKFWFSNCDTWLREQLDSAQTQPTGTVTGGFGIPALPDWSEEPMQQLCSARPRYPILYSLFPVRDEVPPFAKDNPTADPYSSDFFESHNESDLFFVRDDDDTSYIPFANGGRSYEVVRPSEVALKPAAFSPTELKWGLPTAAAGVGATPNDNEDTLIRVCNGACTNNDPLFRIPFKDSAPFNGREMLVTRMLNLNLDMMRRSDFGQSELWLPRSGIIYAYREDAVSEQEIVRPPVTGAACDNDTQIRSTTCQMNAEGDAFDSKDPPVNPSNRITPKPVDYLPDPDRRPHGFRLMHGKVLSRENDQGRGLSFISYNPVYIQGDFNWHQDDPDEGDGNPLEEFNQLLPPDFGPGDFYDRRDLNTDFARNPNVDQWRPSEIVADAVTILSDNFCDGSIEDGMLNAGPTLTNAQVQPGKMVDYGCAGLGHNQTSYLNQNLPNTRPRQNTAKVSWARTNPADSVGLFQNNGDPNPEEGSSPILINRQGNPLIMQDLREVIPYGAGNALGYHTFLVPTDSNKRKSRLPAVANTRVNAIIVNGLVPSRKGQTYGGLHNFPRFLEDWGQNRPLFISGAFLQLYFSNQATAPFDQDVWERGVAEGTTNDAIEYYNAPNRRWGYDVGLQYAPVSPVAARFAGSSSNRSEFYSEPPANDPYIRNLCLRLRAEENINTNCPE